MGGALLVLALISCGGGEGLSSAVSALEGESERDLSLESSHCSTDVANLVQNVFESKSNLPDRSSSENI